MISENLFEMAYVPKWKDQLLLLQEMALPEPWKFTSPAFERKNTNNHILEKYIMSIFRNQVMDYQNALSKEDADCYLCVRNGYICFHTGLLSTRFKAIYAFLEKNRMPGKCDWFFRGFFEDASSGLRNVERLPEKPFPYFRQEQWGFCPNYEIRVNTDHILDDPENLSRIPESIRGFPNLYLLLETGVEMARRTAEFFPSMVVPQLFHGEIQYLLPISLTNPKTTDLAMTISRKEGYYVGSTCLTLEMAYNNARLLARPTAPWLTALVE